MRSLPIELQKELSEDVVCIQHMVTLEAPSATYRWTDGQNAIFYSGAWWIPKGISFEECVASVTGQLDSITFQIDNVDKAFSDLVLSEDIRGSECTVLRVCLDDNIRIVGNVPSILFSGFVDKITLDRRKATVEVFSHMIKWKRITPRRQHTPSCPWTFKGTECGYNGTIYKNPTSDILAGFTRSHLDKNYKCVDDRLDDLCIGGTFTSSDDDGSHPVANAFDRNTTTFWQSANTVPPHWIKVQFAATKKINKYKITQYSNTYSPIDFILQGSNDDTNWVDVDARRGVSWGTETFKSFDFINNTSYSYYRLNIQKNTANGNQTLIKELELFGTWDMVNDSDYNSTSAVTELSDIFGYPATVGLRKDYNALLHLEGPNDSTVFTDEYGHTWTRYGTAKISTGAYKWGASSLLSNATSHVFCSDFETLGGKFTLELWWNPSDITATIQIPMYAVNSSGYGLNLLYNLDGTKKLALYVSSNGTSWNAVNGVTGSYTGWANGTWYKLIVDYDGSTYRVYRGTSGALTLEISASSALPPCPIQNVYIAYYTVGYVDEFRATIWANRYGASASAETAAFVVDYFGGAQAEGTFLASDVTGITVTVRVRCYQTTAGARTLAGLLKIGGITYTASAITPTTSWNGYDFVWTVNPVTGGAWDHDLSIIQGFGYYVPADAGGRTITVGMCWMKISNSITSLTCNLSPERCLELCNRDNFGGFVYISELQTKEFWWGSKQKVWGGRI